MTDQSGEPSAGFRTKRLTKKIFLGVLFGLYEFKFFFKILHISFIKFETIKGIFVAILYRQRGKNAKRFMHSGMAALTAFGMMIAPIVAQEFPGGSVDPWNTPSPSSVLSASTEDPETTTLISDKVRDKAIEYKVLPV